MLSTSLTHPQILSALGKAGHGSLVLIGDGNFPHSTAPAASAERVYLNLRPGMITVLDALEVLVSVLPIEAAAVMVPPDGPPPELHATFAAVMGPNVSIEALGRPEFYAATKTPDLALVIATGDQAHYSNLLLTIGVNPIQ
jgi:L-fucose mutarotase